MKKIHQEFPLGSLFTGHIPNQTELFALLTATRTKSNYTQTLFKLPKKQANIRTFAFVSGKVRVS